MSNTCLSLTVAALFSLAVPAHGAQAPGTRATMFRGTARPDLRRELPSLRHPLPNPIEHQLPVLTEQERARFRPAGAVEAVGMHRMVGREARDAGAWQRAAGGRAVWRMAVRSPGAQGIRVHFRGFDAAGGRLWISDGSGEISAVAGPYTGRGLFVDGDFWSDVVPGERAVLEFEPEGGAEGDLPFEIAEVAHLWTAPEAGSSGPLQAALPCHLDVSCYPEWAESAKAVARMVYEKDDGSYLCSGALVMNRAADFTPYFLTADHCISSDTEARSLQTYWLYQTAGCNQPPPVTRDVPRALGARYLAGGGMERGDFTLLRLSEVPPGVVFAGWKAEEVGDGAPLAGIHHPAGDYKRFSRGVREARDEGSTFSANNHYSVLWSEGHTEGGSSGSPVFSEPGVLVGVLSGGRKTSAGQTKCDLRPDHSYYGKFTAAFPALREYLDGRPPVGSPGSDSGKLLTSGAAQDFSYSVSAATLFSGSTGYRVAVPDGATALDVRLSFSPATADVRLYARLGAPPAVQDGRVVADASLKAENGAATLRLDARSTPALRLGTWYVAIGVMSTGTQVAGRVTATVSTGSNTTPGTVLTSGTPRSISIDAVSSATLFSGDSGYRIVVPDGATKLDIRMAASPAMADIDLYARFGAPPALADGRVTADFRSTGPAADEAVTITPQSSPPLKPGVWYVALGVFTANTAMKVTLTATVSTESTPAAPLVLTSGARQSFSAPALNSPALLGTSYRIAVPAGATRLTVKMDPSSAAFDMAVLVRQGALPEVTATDVFADAISEGNGGSETVVISTASSPALKAGDYYISVASFTTGVALAGAVTATVETDDTSAAPALTSGVPRNFNVGPVSTGTLLTRAAAFRVVVPEGASRLQVKVATSSPGVDIDLYVRFSTAPSVVDRRVVADYSSSGETGDETITVTPASSPALRPGVYFVTLALMTAGVEARGTVTATVDTAPPPPSGATTLTSGVPGKFTLPSVDDATLFTGDYGFRITVPEGATRLEVQLRTATPGVDADLYVRYGADPDLAAGQVVADYSSTSDTGNETIVVTTTSSKPLKAGVYYIALAVYTAGKPASGTVAATVEQAPAGPAPAVGIPLTSGTGAGFSFDAVSSPTLFAGTSVYRITVPSGSGKLQVRLTSANTHADLDLFVRYSIPPEVVDGRVVADHAGSSDSGDELIAVTPYTNPPLRAGVYYAAVAAYTTGQPVLGTISATVYGPEAAPVPLPARGWTIRTGGKALEQESASDEIVPDRLTQGEGGITDGKTESGKARSPRRVCAGGGACF